MQYEDARLDDPDDRALRDSAGERVVTPPRRAVLLAMGAAGAAGAAVAAGCAPPRQSGGQTPSGSFQVPASDIPVGGGKIFPDRKVVVTQPQSGTFHGFSAICTHRGCTVSTVSDGTINCPCHGSRFRITDGSVADGPAPRPLPPVQVSVNGNTVRVQA